MTVEVVHEGATARVFLARPGKANALDSPTLEALAAALENIAPDVRVVVLAGRGRTFCGGADVAELRALDVSTAGAFVGRIHRCCAALRRLPMPVVARLHGAVIGAGLELAAACDLRIAAEGTRFSMPEVRIGIPSVVEAALLPRLMGSGRAAWLVLTGEAIDAQRALQWGLVEAAGADLDSLERNLVDNLLSCDPRALAAQKRLLHLWDEAPLERSVTESIERFAAAYASGTPRGMLPTG